MIDLAEKQAQKVATLREHIRSGQLRIGTITEHGLGAGYDYSVVEHDKDCPLWDCEYEELIRLARIGLEAETELKERIGQGIIVAAYRSGIITAFDLLKRHISFDRLEKILLDAISTTPHDLEKGAAK